jgi:D-alanyl-D-alanine carboxypeptidase/D-alanyl-D-alanine-endopeptidase (penicillin-binding protein 4)
MTRRAWLGASGALLALSPTAVRADATKTLTKVGTKLQQLQTFVHDQKGKLSALVLDLGSGERVGSDAQQALNPASNMKLITAAAALDLLGPDHSFETGLYGKVSERMPTLVLRGEGDPSLDESGVWRLANALSALGVRKIGKLLVDQSRFDDVFVPPAFDQQPSEWATFRAPVSAIAVERNTVAMNVAPTVAGQPARVWFQPAGVVTVQGEVATRKPGTGQNIQLELEPGKPGLVGKVGGHLAEGLPRQRFGKRIDDPRLVPGLVLKALLGREGVSVDEVALGGSDERGRITYHGSDPLSQLVAEMGKNSDNFYAEMVFKAIGASTSTGPSTWATAAQNTLGWLAKINATDPHTRIQNGSGLFDANRVSAETIIRVLAYAMHSPRLRNEYVGQLAIGGVDGTLRSRFRSHREGRRIRAKTGTLAAVDALSGYVLREGGAPLVFSMLVNDVKGQHGAMRSKMGEVVEAILAV